MRGEPLSSYPLILTACCLPNCGGLSYIFGIWGRMKTQLGRNNRITHDEIVSSKRQCCICENLRRRVVAELAKH